MKGVFAVIILAIVLCTNIVLAKMCPTACTMEHNPVCGEDSNGNRMTYANPCSLAVERCFNPDIRYVKHGQC
ncbi:Kazal-type serine protease inhibitor domain [Popillia japonica]|uniref:Kazal-type serine protease inhibitor domain n=1 Tax=Popillia japonica TaxID=7064 RepID=A0AAW1J0U5_POPJA